MQKLVDIGQVIFNPQELLVCLESVSLHPFMSGHSQVKHGVAEEVLEMSNTNMVLVHQVSLDAGRVG